MFFLPWLGIQIYYAKLFFPVALNLKKKRAFYERYVALHTDYVKLDRFLSKDAVLLVPCIRLSAAYAPRPIFFDAAGPPARKTDRFVRAARNDARCWCIIRRLHNWAVSRCQLLRE